MSVDKVRLNEKLALAIIVSGSPLSMTEHPLWIDFFKQIRPTFKLPCRKSISTVYVDKVYAEMQSSITYDLFDANDLHIQLDGWTNINNDGIINFVICKPEPLFVKFLNTKDNRKFFCHYGDNAANVKKSFELVKNVYKGIQPLGCAAHGLHLLCSDIFKVDSVSEFLKQNSSIVSSIKRSQLLSSVFKKHQQIKGINVQLKLPVKTRWGSFLFCLESLMKNKSVLQALAVDDTISISLLRPIKLTLLDDSKFWENVLKMINLLTPIVNAITVLESNHNLIHRVRTAELLDPKSQGLELNADERVDALEFIYNLGVEMKIDIMNDLSDYQSKQGYFAKKFIWENSLITDPVKWWKFLDHISPLSKVAVRILTAPCTSAATERTFSTFSWIHSKKRNRLTTERAGKLTYLSYNWKLKNKKSEISKNTEANNCEESSIVIQQIQSSSSSFNSEKNEENMIISKSDSDSDCDSDSETYILYNDTSSDENSVSCSEKEDEDNY
ncbi:uncharacterized protein LOC103309331 [Acyrthosiphon pisum]|uniref:HAT C-terminal dimerisation domain-containing protein n=1 Tax=Acyrthosiphon pisum TaxID=7029 RepID=A0A8R2B5J2_ACYPI|nr:uncharacterized protein LOC103309331 [Acyrthosiphon pisum]|eukprot:XP_008182740.1 PREDICTED: uncharacterized protein LOC103309331 [Acyrthosiphon pisum]